ncbi:MAG: hypothetical protein R3220_09435 [Balneolaceae bacterium]|nr:hypothetical protein [Balneolaceae bacterium]
MREIVCGCLEESADRKELKALIDICHTMALAYLRMKASSRKLYMIRGERLEDLAWDFIADLFEKNEDGELVKLQEYFENSAIDQLSDHEIKIELRKLVFTKVEDNVFRSFGENDPSLRKIIRNLKLAIRNNDCQNCVCYDDGNIITEENGNQRLPVMPSEFMQMKLSSRLGEKMQIPEILIEVINILEDQEQYQKRFSLVTLAAIIRETFVHFNESRTKVNQKPFAERYLLNGEFEEILDKSSEKVRTTTGIKYVEKGKITKQELLLYTNAARDIVRDHFLDNQEDYSQFEYLKEHMPNLEYLEFRESKRQILEYLVKLIRRELVGIFKDDWH